MEQEKKTFSVKCFSCKIDFVSDNDLDLDGYGHCPPCKKNREERARKIDEIIAQRRAKRTNTIKKQVPQTIPGTNWINAKQFLGGN